MWSKKRDSYDFKNHDEQIVNPVTAVVYNSLSANTQNSLEITSNQNPDISILSRRNSIALKSNELEKIEEAITVGFNDTFGAENEAKQKTECEIARTNLRQNKKIIFDDHLIELDEFIKRYETSISDGLSDSQVKIRQERDGKNVLTKKKSKPLILRYLNEVFGGYNVILWIATILCFICWRPLGGEEPSVYNLVLAIFLFVAIIIQSTFSFLNQCRSDNLMASFEKMMPSKTSVRRNGKWIEEDSTKLVVGDVVRLSSGEKIPADLRIIECKQASVDKSFLTGECEPVRLSLTSIDSNLYETKNIAMFGSLVMEGNAIGIIFKIGDDTVIAKISSLVLNTKGKITTMQREINYFALVIGSLSIGTGFLTFIIWFLFIKPYHPTFLDYSGIISACIGVVVSFFPEGKL